MSTKDWLERRTPEELISHFALLRHLPQIDFRGHAYRQDVKTELEKRAINLIEFMSRLDDSA